MNLKVKCSKNSFIGKKSGKKTAGTFWEKAIPAGAAAMLMLVLMAVPDRRFDRYVFQENIINRYCETTIKTVVYYLNK